MGVFRKEGFGLDYLSSYLSVLPNYDREEVEKLVQENNDLFETKVITKEEFEALINKLSERQEKSTELEAVGEKLDAEHFNNMHASVDLDLSRLYDSHSIIEKVVTNYNRILQGTLDDVEREIKSLNRRVEELNLKAQGESNLILKTYGFEESDKDKHMEINDGSNSSLFLDRDGEELESASLNRSFHQHFLSLPVKTVDNALQDSGGRVRATISIVDQPENVITNPNHSPKNAISGSDRDYWAQAVLSDSPITSRVKKV